MVLIEDEDLRKHHRGDDIEDAVIEQSSFCKQRRENGVEKRAYLVEGVVMPWKHAMLCV